MQTNETIKWHALPVGEVAQKLTVNESTGLGSADVKERQAKYGLNEMTARGGVPGWLRFLRQFNQAVVYILLGATVGCFFLAEYVEAYVILGVVLVNALIGFIQEGRAERAISALSKMMTTEANVRREGKKVRVPSAELVPGDVV